MSFFRKAQFGTRFQEALNITKPLVNWKTGVLFFLILVFSLDTLDGGIFFTWDKLCLMAV